MRYYIEGRYLENGGNYFEEFDTLEDQQQAVLCIKETWEEYTKHSYSKVHGANVVSYIGLQVGYEVTDYEAAEA